MARQTTLLPFRTSLTRYGGDSQLILGSSPHFILQYAGCKIIFFDAGVYYVTDTITIPAGTQIVGEAWSVVLGGGSNFQSQTNPHVVVQAGTAGSEGVLEISDMLFSTAGPSKEDTTLPGII